MKIAALTLSYPNLSEQFQIREFDGLAARGHDVRVFTKREVSTSPLVVETALPVALWTDENVRAFAPDVLYASLGFAAHERALYLSHVMGTPYACKAWEGYDAFTQPSPGFYGPLLRDPRCLAVLVEDAWMVDYAARAMGMAGPKVRVIPNGIDCDVFTPWSLDPSQRLEWPHSKRVRLLALSRFVKKKGLFHLARVFRDLRPEGAELVILGYGPEEENIRAAAGLNTGITFLPPVPPSALPTCYHHADIFVAPCIETRNGDADGVPTTVLEAMACGLPVIASDLLSMREYITHDVNGWLCRPGNETDLRDAIVRLIGDAPLRARLGAAARETAVAQFSLTRSIDELEEVLGGR